MRKEISALRLLFVPLLFGNGILTLFSRLAEIIFKIERDKPLAQSVQA